MGKGLVVAVVAVLGLVFCATTVVQAVGGIAECKLQGDDREVSTGPVTVTAVFPGFLYVEDSLRTAGIRVLPCCLEPELWQSLTVDGVIETTTAGERVIRAKSIVPVKGLSVLSPLGLRGRDLCGGDWFYDQLDGSGQMGVPGSYGLNNVGLLVSLRGAIIHDEPGGKGPAWFTLDDGSGSSVKVILPPGMDVDPAWQYAVVTGISSLEEGYKQSLPVLLVRGKPDIATHGWELKPAAVARPENAAPGQSIGFDGRLSTSGMPSRDIASYEWDFDYSGTFSADATGQCPSFHYSTFGPRTVALRVSDNAPEPRWGIVTFPVSVDQGNLPPVARPGGPYVIGENESITLDGSGSSDPNADAGDSIVGYSWDLNNDGNYGELAGAKPLVTWAQLRGLGMGWGSFTIGLRVTDSFGSTAQRSTTLSMYPNEPVAAFCVAPEPVRPGEAASLDGSLSYHPRPDRQIVSYEWDFDYDFAEFNVDATGVNTTFTPAMLGSYLIGLRVTDNGLPARSSIVIHGLDATASNLPPIARPGGPYAISLGESLQLNGNASYDPDADIGDMIVSYAWDIDGDGYYGDVTGASVSLSWAQLDAWGIGLGTSMIGLRVTDARGGVAAASAELQVYANTPTAVIVARPNPAPVNYTLTLDGSRSKHGRPDRQIVQYLWDLDYDGSTFTADAAGATTSVACDHAGTRTVALRVIDNNVPQLSSTTTATIQTVAGNVPPVADPGGPYEITLGSELVLQATGSFDPNDGDGIASCGWDLNGDGNYGDAVGATMRLAWSGLVGLGLGAPGAHTIRLRAVDYLGAVGTGETTLTVYPLQPVAAFATLPPDRCGCSEWVSFDANESYHPWPARTIVSYEWDFDYTGAFSVDATGPAVSYAFPRIGTRVIALRVADDLGSIDTATRPITVEPRSGPTANPGGPYATNTGESLVLDGTASHDPDQACGDSITRYEWDVNGDGMYNDAVSSRPTLTWSQVQALMQAAGRPVTGRFTVSLRVADTTGRTAQRSTTLMIYDNAPSAVIDASTTAAAPGQSIEFSAARSSHGRPDRQIASYEWDFDYDGKVFVADAVGLNVAHSFTRFGQFTVALRVTDDNAPPRTSTATLKVQVDQGNLAPVAHPGGPYSIQSGSELVLNGDASYDPDSEWGDSIMGFAWDLNDDGVYGDVNGAKPVATWAHLAALGLGKGTHTIRLRVTDAFGAAGTSYTRLEIK